ncbi:MAG: alpha-L-fucosidase [Bryobacteraceae bacterium]
MKKIGITLALTSLALMAAQAPERSKGERGAWLKDSRFAMFIHWGLYSELGGQWKDHTYYGISEWIMNRAKIPVAQYEAVAGRFNPVDFNATEWARVAKSAGMRHIMITSKHHDGFAMFGSAASRYNIVDATPFHRDVMKELAAACKAEGLRMGFYYSQSQDWHERDAVGNTWDFATAGDFPRYLKGKAMPQIKELLSNYGPIATIWFDTPGPITPAQSRELVDLVHRLQPQAIVNSRIGNDLGDYDTLGDMEIPRQPRAGLWETVDTHNDSWGYAANDINFKNAREVVERLVQVVGKGGVYMLNVGPDGKGRIPAESVRVLGEVGQWVKKHEAAIHGSGPTPLASLPWGECTTQGNTLYLHVLDWPADGRLVVPGLQSKVIRAQVEGASAAVKTIDGGVVVQLPAVRPAEIVPVVSLEMEGEVKADRGAFVLSGHRNRLDPGIATLTGCKRSKLSWMEKFGDWKSEECAGGWQGAGSAATWAFRTLEPGVFRLEVEYSCPQEADHSEWQVTVDGQRITFPAIDSGERAKRAVFGGEYPRFRSYRVGAIHLAKSGPHKVAIGPTGAEGKGVRIASVTLAPMSR